MEDPLGSFNVGPRGELVFGDEGDRLDDKSRAEAEKASREKLNHERRTKRLRVTARRDGAEPSKSLC